MGRKLQKGLRMFGLIILVLLPLLGINISVIYNLSKNAANRSMTAMINQIDTLLLTEEPEAAVEKFWAEPKTCIYIADTEFYRILATNDAAHAECEIADLGVAVSSIAKYDLYFFNAKIDDVSCFCVASEANGYYIMVTNPKDYVYSGVLPTTGVMLIYLLFACAFIALIVYGTTKEMFAEEDRANRDPMTGFLNRRAFESIVAANPGIPTDQNLAFFAFDINGLKQVNDNLGHDAGDELIRGASECILKAFGNYGKLFRMGGDEFVALLSIDPADVPDREEHFEEIIAGWSGKKVQSMAISTGYVTRHEFPDKTIRELEKMADERMYRAKEQYYKRAGVDRRRKH